MARAMHSRCCWPPESPSALSCRRSFTSSHSAAPRRLRSTISSSVALVAHAVDAQAVDHVLVDRLRERVRLLEHHADALAQLDHVDARVVDVDAVERISPSMRTPSIRSFMRLRQRSSVRLAAARRPDERGDLAGRRCRHRDVVQRLLLAVPGQRQTHRSSSARRWRRVPGTARLHCGDPKLAVAEPDRPWSWPSSFAASDSADVCTSAQPVAHHDRRQVQAPRRSAAATCVVVKTMRLAPPRRSGLWKPTS